MRPIYETNKDLSNEGKVKGVAHKSDSATPAHFIAVSSSAATAG